MFLVDKYYQELNYLTYNSSIINKIIESFDAHNQYYSDIKNIVELPNDEFYKIIQSIEYGMWRYANFQHLIIYGAHGCNKEYIVNYLLEKIYGKTANDVKDVEYIVSGYSNTKKKILIKQSKYHIVIEPKSNGFDKYLIQEIIQNYAKSEPLSIIKNRKLFKIVIINKIDNLSYYAQASLRRTMEKYSKSCKFILISDQVSKIIEPIRSRCLMIRIPFPSENQILETILYICDKENINISNKQIFDIVKKSENKINIAIWMLEMAKYGIQYDKTWEIVIDHMVLIIINKDTNTCKKLFASMKKIRELFYILHITNIQTQTILRKLMDKLLDSVDCIEQKYYIIDTTSIFEQRLIQGTRHIIHIEAYVTKLINLFTNHGDVVFKHDIVESLEI